MKRIPSANDVPQLPAGLRDTCRVESRLHQRDPFTQYIKHKNVSRTLKLIAAGLFTSHRFMNSFIHISAYYQFISVLVLEIEFINSLPETMMCEKVLCSRSDAKNGTFPRRHNKRVRERVRVSDKEVAREEGVNLGENQPFAPSTESGMPVARKCDKSSCCSNSRDRVTGQQVSQQQSAENTRISMRKKIQSDLLPADFFPSFVFWARQPIFISTGGKLFLLEG